MHGLVTFDENGYAPEPQSSAARWMGNMWAKYTSSSQICTRLTAIVVWTDVLHLDQAEG